ncbi:MAG: hypothetical protein VB082_01215 [Christensenella sp.]|nr:hypothetical protein [Christensenella sp.]
MKHNESMTCLYGSETAEKSHPQIALRGALDSLLARAVYTCAYARENGWEAETVELAEVVCVIRTLIGCEAGNKEPGIEKILGFSLEEAREASYFPEKYLHTQHYFPNEDSDLLSAVINMLRTEIRQTERACVCAGLDEYVNRGIQKVLNRLSSIVYIIMLKHNAK